jgi:hypothetical protein
MAATATSIGLQLSCVALPGLRRVMGLEPLGTQALLVVSLALLLTYATSEILVRVLRTESRRVSAPAH